MLALCDLHSLSCGDHSHFRPNHCCLPPTALQPSVCVPFNTSCIASCGLFTILPICVPSPTICLPCPEAMPRRMHPYRLGTLTCRLATCLFNHPIPMFCIHYCPSTGPRALPRRVFIPSATICIPSPVVCIPSLAVSMPSLAIPVPARAAVCASSHHHHPNPVYLQSTSSLCPLHTGTRVCGALWEFCARSVLQPSAVHIPRMYSLS